MTPYQSRALSLVAKGYNIIKIAAGQKFPGYEHWQNTRTTEADIAKWPAKGNIGLLTENTPAIDIDCTNEELALEMEQFVLDLLGDTAIRVGRAPKRLLVFRTNTPFRKLDSGFYADADGVKHKLEVLGLGQQFVAYGIHPDTHKPYTWVSQDALHDLDVRDLPLLDADSALLVVQEFVRRAEARGWKKVSRDLGPSQAVDDFWFLRPKPDVSNAEVEEALMLFPNPGRDYDLWVKVGAALHDHFEGDVEGLELWEKWSEQSELYDPSLTESKWKSFGRYTGQPTTVAFLLAETKNLRKKEKAKEKAADERDTRSPLLEAIAACENADDLVGSILHDVASARLDPMNEEMVLKEINARRRVLKAPTISLTALRKKLQDIRSGDSDKRGGLGLMLEKALADKVLDMCFSGGEQLIFFSELWWVYRGGVWRRTEENMVAAAVQDAVLRLQSEQDEMALELANAVAESRGDRLTGVVNTILSTIRRVVGQDGYDDPLNLRASRIPRVVNCLNGEIWFDLDGSLKFKRHSPESRLTSQVACKFDPKAKCPEWDRMVRKVFKSCDDVEDVIRHFHEVFGYMLQPDRHQAVWAMLKGPGGNGKTTMLDVIRELMGDNAVLSVSIADLANGANSHFTDSAQGKLMMLDDDFRAGAILPDDWLKKFSEAKSITANPKFGKPYNFTARCTPVILTNGWPATTDLSDGLRRRALVFETKHVLTAAEKDPRHLMEIRENEMPGVLNRLLQGLIRVLQRGQSFQVPAECETSKHRWITMSNPTARFYELIVERTDNIHDRITCAALYDAYRQWCSYDEGNVRVLGRNKFYEAMETMGLKKRNHSGVMIYTNLTLRHIEGVESSFFDEL